MKTYFFCLLFLSLPLFAEEVSELGAPNVDSLDSRDGCSPHYSGASIIVYNHDCFQAGFEMLERQTKRTDPFFEWGGGSRAAIVSDGEAQCAARAGEEKWSFEIGSFSNGDCREIKDDPFAGEYTVRVESTVMTTCWVCPTSEVPR